MPVEPQETKIFNLIPTADVGERVLRLWVREQDIRADTSLTTGTALTAFLPMLPRADATLLGYGSYLLTRPAGRRGDGYLGFDFAKPKTTAQLRTPFKTTRVWQDYTWPDVLKILLAVQGDEEDEVEAQGGQYPGVGGTVDRYNQKTRTKTEDRLLYFPGSRRATEFIVREYLSPTPFTGLQVERPIPTQVHYNHRGMERRLTCLHPTVTVPELLQGARMIAGFGTPNATDVFGKGLVFPATNMLEWVPHLCRAEMSDEGGVYYLRTYEALPPELPRAQRL